jgi:tripartite-type tricarboxylate transporter receptor subunit TctC
MKLPRRRFLHLAAGAVALPLSSRIAGADTYPSRPVRWIVPYPPGGSADIVARLMGQWLSERLGQSFVIDNRPGGAANIGTEAVVRSAPDGYTLLLVSGVHAINATLFDNLNYNFIRDIAPIAGILRVPGILLINPSVPAKTVPEFIAYAKANPGKINLATSGNGTPGHVGGELFKMMTGLTLVNVPYRGDAPAVADLLGGQVQAWFGSPAVSIEYMKAGRLRGLAVSTAVRSELLPDLPTIAETVPGYELSSWFGVGAPSGTPADIVGKLNREINLALADPRMKARFADLSGTALPGSPADFSKLIAKETEKFGKVVKFANIKPE